MTLKGLAAAGLLPAAVLFLSVAWHARYLDGPPPGFTGDFGEPNCSSCHMDAEVIADAPGLVFEGIPERYESGRSYPITITVHHPGIGAAGFEISARTPGNTPAGAWRATDTRVKVVADSGTGVSYAIHTAEGAALAAPDTGRWQMEWKAPESSGDTVVFSAAANAANGDDSNFGDVILTKRATSASRHTP